jgi:LysM domain
LAVAPAAVVVARERAHLTRRGQLVLIALSAVVVLAVAGLLISRTGGTATERPEPVGQRSIVVQPGQTLWSIAKDVAPGRDIREVIYEIRRINGLDNAMVRSGQTLELPTGWQVLLVTIPDAVARGPGWSSSEWKFGGDTATKGLPDEGGAAYGCYQI